MLELSDRLMSRLSAGLIVPLAAPSPVTRREVLRQVCEQRQITLSERAEQQLVDQAELTIPDMLGLLSQLGVERFPFFQQDFSRYYIALGFPVQAIGPAEQETIVFGLAGVVDVPIVDDDRIYDLPLE